MFTGQFCHLGAGISLEIHGVQLSCVWALALLASWGDKVLDPQVLSPIHAGQDIAQAQQFAVAEILHAKRTFLVPSQLRGKAGLNSDLPNLGLYPKLLQTSLITELWCLASCQPEMFKAEWINLQALTENAMGTCLLKKISLCSCPEFLKTGESPSDLFPLKKLSLLVSAS